uniref:Very-long-chain (3R)-3-hydroxyacyl-CoA dehydratase n=3 Tax=Strigidae TaxID=30459 RepID=A0A8C0IFP6_BUBBB
MLVNTYDLHGNDFSISLLCQNFLSLQDVSFVPYILNRSLLQFAQKRSLRMKKVLESVILFLVVWTVTEITRYSFYTFNLLNHLPYFIKWARYNFFIILYPAGVAGELLTIYAALPYVKKTGMFSLRLPNKYNVSFDYYYFLIIVMFSYVPLFPQLYFHMLRQRRRVLHGEVIVEKDD